MAAATNGLPEDPALLRARLTEVEARYAQSQVQFRELRTWYDKLKRHHRELLWSEAVLAREGLEEAMPGPPIADADRANGHIGGGFVLRHHLGAGAFATVYAAIDKEGRPCAMKRINKYHIKSLESLRNVAGELRALRAAVGCPNLVWVRGVVASETYLSFVMELFGTSNLQEAGAARPQDVRRAAPRIVRGVANGLAHLHARDLHHRDIKPENVLFCVEINWCVGCTRQFFSKSFLGDDAAVLARSSGKESASPRHRAGIASMAWRTTRRFSTNAP